MFIISKEFHFSASHILSGLRDGHPCGRMHGHNYIVTVYLRSEELNEVGFVTDYNDLKPIKEFIDNVLDHRHLNDVFPGMNPSAELMSREIYRLFKPQFPQLYKVEISETPKTKASYEE
ncbi:MAG: 6-carboxytetrahydropterin synthase QueD [Bacteroidota bacterium]|jgi:6-pyruvoyltetrahydropterin/6-carboxytetrahydropterin synthase